jgi:hypothetical protein
MTAAGSRKAIATKQARWERLTSDLDALREMAVIVQADQSAWRGSDAPGRYLDAWRAGGDTLRDYEAASSAAADQRNAAYDEAVAAFAARFGVSPWYIERFRHHVSRRFHDMRRAVDAAARPVIQAPVAAAYEAVAACLEAWADALERDEPVARWREHPDRLDGLIAEVERLGALLSTNDPLASALRWPIHWNGRASLEKACPEYAPLRRRLEAAYDRLDRAYRRRFGDRDDGRDGDEKVPV